MRRVACGGAEKFRDVVSRLWHQLWKIRCTNHSMHGFGDWTEFVLSVKIRTGSRLSKFLVTTIKWQGATYVLLAHDLRCCRWIPRVGAGRPSN
jgi:hypothetical protein